MKKKVNMKEKVKAFWKEHGVEIEAGATVIGVAIMSGCIGWQICKLDVRRKGYIRLNEPLMRFLRDADMSLDGKVKDIHMWGSNDLSERFKVADLGKLGEQMRVADGVSFDDAFGGFTHILSIGPKD